MKSCLFAAIAALAVAVAASAHAGSGQHSSGLSGPNDAGSTASAMRMGTNSAAGSSAASLSSLLADWDRIAFDPPMKPGQFRVYGREGHITSGPGYNAMVSLIRSAVRDSRERRDQEALTKITKVRGMLGR
jgi:hypothetical protein